MHKGFVGRDEMGKGGPDMSLQKTLTAAVILSITIITSAQANVIWDFTETSVTPIAPNP